MNLSEALPHGPSRARLAKVHSDLAAIVARCATYRPGTFIVTEGLRSLERQKTLMAAGASKTLRSRHLTGHAVDLAPLVDGKVRWDWPLFYDLAAAMKAAAAELNLPLEWGGDWKSFKDGPHFQLPWKTHPA